MKGAEHSALIVDHREAADQAQISKKSDFHKTNPDLDVAEPWEKRNDFQGF
jgi:hypothetical protein